MCVCVCVCGGGGGGGGGGQRLSRFLLTLSPRSQRHASRATRTAVTLCFPKQFASSHAGKSRVEGKVKQKNSFESLPTPQKW